MRAIRVGRTLSRIKCWLGFWRVNVSNPAKCQRELLKSDTLEERLLAVVKSFTGNVLAVNEALFHRVTTQTTANDVLVTL